jgi:hypothetical protein
MRRCIALALPCWIVAAPVATFAQNAAACRHQAMHQGMHHGMPGHAPCWCGDMTGNAALLASDAPALPSDWTVLPSGAAPLGTVITLPSDAPPISPSYAPTPPPPNERRIS